MNGKDKGHDDDGADMEPGQGLSDEELRLILAEKDKLVTQLEDELRRLNTTDLSGRIRQLEDIIKLQGQPIHIKARSSTRCARR